jgi:hypothetical protein
MTAHLQWPDIVMMISGFVAIVGLGGALAARINARARASAATAIAAYVAEPTKTRSVDSRRSDFEIWEEHRDGRSIFGALAKLLFVVFNLWMLIELAWFIAKVEQIRGQYADNGFAQIGINLAASGRFQELLVEWIIGAGILGAVVLGTRGRKFLIRRTQDPR